MIYCTNLKLLNSHTVVVKQHQKKYYILHIAFISSVASSHGSDKYSEFNFISLFTFLSKQKALYEQYFFEYTFSKNI